MLFSQLQNFLFFSRGLELLEYLSLSYVDVSQEHLKRGSVQIYEVFLCSTKLLDHTHIHTWAESLQNRV